MAGAAALTRLWQTLQASSRCRRSCCAGGLPREPLAIRPACRTHGYRGGLPLIHSVNGFRLHEPAMYLECQTKFGDIPWPGEGSAGTFLDSVQPVADRVRVAN